MFVYLAHVRPESRVMLSTTMRRREEAAEGPSIDSRQPFLPSSKRLRQRTRTTVALGVAQLSPPSRSCDTDVAIAASSRKAHHTALLSRSGSCLGAQFGWKCDCHATHRGAAIRKNRCMVNSPCTALLQRYGLACRAAPALSQNR